MTKRRAAETATGNPKRPRPKGRPKRVETAIRLAQRLAHVLVATADGAGLPHVAAAGSVAQAPGGRLAVGAWFCPGTVENVAANPRIALVAWDPETDQGYQILGGVERIDELGMLDGYSPAEQAGPPLPQVERRLIVRVDKVLDFHHAPHSDMED